MRTKDRQIVKKLHKEVKIYYMVRSWSWAYVHTIKEKV